jgi:hypothetical protein
MCIMYVFALLYTLCLRIMNMYHYMYRQPSSTNTAYACTRPETAGLSRGRRITWKRCLMLGRERHSLGDKSSEVMRDDKRTFVCHQNVRARAL